MTAIRRAGAVALGVMLIAGCLTSEGLLFDAKNAKAVVFADGDYTACQFEEETAAPECMTIGISHDASGLHSFSVEGEDDVTHARFRSIGRSGFAAQLWATDDDDPFYFLATRGNGVVTMAMIDCETLPVSYKKKYVARGALEVRDESTCVAKTAAAVVAAAKAWRRTDAPKTAARIVYTKKDGA